MYRGNLSTAAFAADEPCFGGRTYDYFSGSQLSFILSMLALGVFLIRMSVCTGELVFER